MQKNLNIQNKMESTHSNEESNNLNILQNKEKFSQFLEKNNKQFILNYQKTIERFFWLANENPDLIQINNENLEWSPYDNEDNIFLEYHFQKHKELDLFKEEIKIDDHPQIGEWKIQFFPKMKQYHSIDTHRQRAIIRSDPNIVENIKRKNRFIENNQNINNVKINTLNNLDEKNNSYILQYFNFYKFKIVKNKEVEFKCLKKFSSILEEERCLKKTF